jgi:hypothetical protein
MTVRSSEEVLRECEFTCARLQITSVVRSLIWVEMGDRVEDGLMQRPDSSQYIYKNLELT